jgi:arginine decarboxylase
MFPVPASVFLTKGIGIHRHRLTSFELALRDADIEQQNLVSISSILPPHCKLLSRTEGVATMRPGEITFSVLARAETDEPGRHSMPASAWRGRPIPKCTVILPSITVSA